MIEHINKTIDRYLNTNAEEADTERTKYPWHMPGHKRKPAPWELYDADGNVSCEEEGSVEAEVTGNNMFSRIFSRDLTEVPGLDDLHYPTEMIKLSMEELEKVYGSYKTYYLVNGATCGNLAAIFACVKEDIAGDKASEIKSDRYYSGTGRSNNASNTVIRSDGKTEHVSYDSYSEKIMKNKKQKAVIIARNCHKSVFNAMQLLDVKPIYIYPEISNELSIDGEIRAEDIRKAIERNSQLDIRCCIITSPTYEGVISDIRAISEVLHEAGIPLIVDEAHGAHFPFYVSMSESTEMNTENGMTDHFADSIENDIQNNCGIDKYDFPCSALYLGADIVIQSLHKTLPSLTQTAVLHISKTSMNDNSGGHNSQSIKDENSNMNRIRDNQLDALARNIEKYLSIFQSSSPSYIFLQTMEKCISWCDANRVEFKEHYERILHFREVFKQAGLKNLRLFEYKAESDTEPDHISPDFTRLVFMVDGITGRKAAEILEEKYGLVFEMAGTDYITAISTVADVENDLQELLSALIDFDKYISDNKEETAEAGIKISISLKTDEGVLPLEKAAGKRITDYIYVYPPGIPIIAPYEIIKEEHIREVYHSAICGYEIRSVSCRVIIQKRKENINE